MLIWTGRGWIAFVIMLACLFGGIWLCDAWLGDGYFAAHIWPKLAALVVCSALCWVTGRRLNRGLPHRVVDVSKSAFSTATHESHTLGFIRVEYAGLIAAVLYGLVALDDLGWI